MAQHAGLSFYLLICSPEQQQKLNEVFCWGETVARVKLHLEWKLNRDGELHNGPTTE